MSKVPESHALVLSLFFGVTRGFPGSSRHGSVEVNWMSIQEDTGSIPALAQEVKGSGVAMSCGVWFAGVASTRPCCFCGVGRQLQLPFSL